MNRLFGVELIRNGIVYIALPEVRHDLQPITIIIIEELYRRKALAELRLIEVRALDLLHIKRRAVDAIEALLIEVKVDRTISKLT